MQERSETGQGWAPMILSTLLEHMSYVNLNDWSGVARQIAVKVLLAVRMEANILSMLLL